MATRKTTRKDDNTTSEIVGAGVGVAGGAAAGAAIGSVAGPVGTGVGAVIGAVAGGLAGKEVADMIDPDEEVQYWEREYTQRPYYQQGKTFDEYRPAYRYGVEAVNKHPGTPFEDAEARLRRNWPKYRGENCSLTWTRARDAIRDAYDRTLRLHEERLEVNKRPVQTGEVTVRKEVKTEHRTVTVPVQREEVVISRRPVSESAPAAAIGTETEEVRVPVKQDEVHVTKRTVPREEVRVGRRKVQETRQVEGTVRKEELKVEKEGQARVENETCPNPPL